MKINTYICLFIILTKFTAAILIAGIVTGFIYIIIRAVKKYIQYRNEDLQLKKEILMELKNNK